MDISQELTIINNAVEEHKLNSIFALFSGGHDSLCATYIASQHPLFKGVVHIDTGIGIPETQQYVIDTCKYFGWELRIYKAMEYTKRDGTKHPQDYEDFVRRYGFPTPPNTKSCILD